MGYTQKLGLLAQSVFQDSSLNVGIGGSPSGTYKLEVTGTAKVSSTLLVSGAATFSSSETNPLTLYSTTTSGEGHKIQWQGNYLSNLIVADIRGNGSGAGGAFIIRTADTSSVLQTRLTITNVGKVTIPSGAYGLSYFSMNYTNANAGSREWAIGSDTAGWGSFSIGQATTQGGSTFSDKIIISSAGNVGIGINSTSAKLYVLGSNEVFNVAGTNAVSTYTGYYYNTSTLVGYIGNGSSILSGAASDSFIFRSEGALVYAIGNSEKMRITSGGDVGIGQAPSDASFRLVIKGADTTAGKFAIYCYNSGGVDLFGVRNDGAFYTGTAVNSPYNLTSGSAANCFINTNGFLYRSTSSLKYKKNVQDYTKGLAEVLQLRPVSYESINEEEAGNIYAGLIAEEIHDLGLTEFVQYRTDGTPDALAYANMIALLTKAIQEQNQTIQNLQAQNQDLKSRLDKAGL